MKAWTVIACAGIVTLLTPGHKFGLAGNVSPIGMHQGGLATGSGYGPGRSDFGYGANGIFQGGLATGSGYGFGPGRTGYGQAGFGYGAKGVYQGGLATGSGYGFGPGRTGYGQAGFGYGAKGVYQGGLATGSGFGYGPGQTGYGYGANGIYQGGFAPGRGGYGPGYSGTLASEALKTSYSNFDGRNYNFAYDIQDPATQNFQSRQESGSADPNGQVTGSYSLVEPDGSTRIVNYVADWVNGFRATVQDKNGVTNHGFNTNGIDGRYGNVRAFNGGVDGTHGAAWGVHDGGNLKGSNNGGVGKVASQGKY